MDPVKQHMNLLTRRHFFKKGAVGLGVPALASLMANNASAGALDRTQTGGLPDLPHFAPKAKRAIYLFAAGAPSQIDTLDYKPKMNEFFDKDLPESIRKGQRLTTMTSGQKRFPVAPSIFKFKQYGKSGAWVGLSTRSSSRVSAKMPRSASLRPQLWTAMKG